VNQLLKRGEEVRAKMRLNRPPKFKVLTIGFFIGAYSVVQPGLSHHVFAEEQKSEVDELQSGSDVTTEVPGAD
jgi:hypothetical protein